jgi:hypothetical protein
MLFVIESSGGILWTWQYSFGFRKRQKFLEQVSKKHFCLMAQRPHSVLGTSIVEVSRPHKIRQTNTHDRTPLNEWSAHRRGSTQHTTNTGDENPCVQLDSNPQSLQLRGSRTTPLDRTANWLCKKCYAQLLGHCQLIFSLHRTVYSARVLIARNP